MNAFIYTHQRKGGRYQIVQFAKPAGTLRSTGAQQLVIYKDLVTEQEYVREELDFRLSFAIVRDGTRLEEADIVAREGCCGQDCETCTGGTCPRAPSAS